MKNLKNILKYYLVIGSDDCKYHQLITIVSAAIKGGVTCVQIREKTANDNQLIVLARQILTILPSDIPLIINDCVDVAKFLDLGLHIGQDDMSYAAARKVLGKRAIIGLSIHSKSQAIEYKQCGADYFGIGPVFSTHSKDDAQEPIGPGKLVEIVQILSPNPCVAIGGVNLTTINHLKRLNAYGIAVISAIAGARRPYLAAKTLGDKLS